MSYLSNRKLNGGGEEAVEPFKCLPWREKDGTAAIRVIYGEVNSSLPGWSSYKIPEGMDGKDLVNPYFFAIKDFQPGLSYIVLTVNFSTDALVPNEKHYLQIHKEIPEDKIEGKTVYKQFPIAIIKNENGQLKVDFQYFTGHVSFRVYFAVVNGAAVIEYFECKGDKPTEVPLKSEN
jgi:hypothetical protein